jgi:hypothetical protein
METINAKEFITQRKSKIANGLQIKMKDIGGETKRIFTIEASAFLICKHLNSEGQPFKLFIFERLKAEKPKGKISYDTWETKKNSKHPNIEYRFGYYIIGKNGNKNGRWTWGQFCPMIGHNDFIKLIDLAHKEGVILDE